MKVGDEESSTELGEKRKAEREKLEWSKDYN